MSGSMALAGILATPLVGLVLVSLSGRWPNLREGITLSTAVVLFAQVLGLYGAVADGARPELVLLPMLPEVSLQLTAEPLGMLFGLIASGLWIISSIYSIGYMRGNQEGNQTRFFVCFAGGDIADALAVVQVVAAPESDGAVGGRREQVAQGGHRAVVQVGRA